MAKYNKSAYENKKYTVQGLFYKEGLSIPEISERTKVPVPIVMDYTVLQHTSFKGSDSVDLVAKKAGYLDVLAVLIELAKVETPQGQKNFREVLEHQFYLDSIFSDWGI